MLRENERLFDARQRDEHFVTAITIGKLSNVTAQAIREGRAFLCMRNPRRQIRLRVRRSAA